MKEFISKMNSRGQVTIPIEIREFLGIKSNDKIAFVVDSEGNIQMRVSRHSVIASLRGTAGSLKKPLSWQQIQEIAQEDRLKAKYESE